MIILTGCAPKAAINNHEVVTVQSAKFDSRTYFSDGQIPVPTIEDRKRLGTVTIVPAQYAPDLNFITFAKGGLAGAGEGAAQWGGDAALAALLTGAVLISIAPIAAPVVIIGAAGATAGMTAAGGVKGALNALPTEKAQEIESAIAATAIRLDAQRSLAEHVTQELQKLTWVHFKAVEMAGPTTPGERPVYASWRMQGVDTVLDIAMTKIGFEGCGPGFFDKKCPRASDKTLISLFMIARVRLVRVADGATQYERAFFYKSSLREFPHWAANDAQALEVELDRGYQDLAERISDELLMVTPINLPAPAMFSSAPCGLPPVYPVFEMISVYKNGQDKTPRHCDGLVFSMVDSLLPTLRWSVFPRDIDRKELDPAVLARIRDVTYDLRIWDVEGCTRGRLVYDRTGLTEANHQLEEPLEPGQVYFWSFRAQFRYEDQSMVTRWARIRSMCNWDVIWDAEYYRFKAPD